MFKGWSINYCNCDLWISIKQWDDPSPAITIHHPIGTQHHQLLLARPSPTPIFQKINMSWFVLAFLQLHFRTEITINQVPLVREVEAEGSAAQMTPARDCRWEGMMKNRIHRLDPQFGR